RGLPEARSVPARWERDRAEFTREAIRIAEGGLPRGRHDSAVGAAVRLSAMERAQQAFEAQRALDDPMVMVEHRLEGRAFAGEVVAVELDRKIVPPRSEEHTSELQSRENLVCRLLLEKK